MFKINMYLANLYFFKVAIELPVKSVKYVQSQQ